ncbi:histidine--tRNA ligase [Chlorobiota bacterium]|nr:histidine--tRNA ligase [Chlorobiota bacterium]
MQAIRGTKDIISPEIYTWQYIEHIISILTNQFGYSEIRTPIFESIDVFKRTIGENTDVVGKEMYTFPDKGGDILTLRPEATASVVRAAVQHNITAQQQLSRVWYNGPFFRYERPQKGRQRQFHQFGAELLCAASVEADIEIISLAYTFLQKLGISNSVLSINTLATPQVRSIYRSVLLDYFQSNINTLSEDSQKRLVLNPLRILDSKNLDDKLIAANAPKLLDYLDDESTIHFDKVCEYLTRLNIPFIQQSTLVRGLDYYSHTVFEFTSNALGSQDALGGGGRYNDLFEQFGGKNTPSIGFAFGIERLIIAMNAHGFSPDTINPDYYIIGFESNDARSKAIQTAHMIRNTTNYIVITDVQNRSLKAQMKDADKHNAQFAIIIGPEEADKSECIVKNLKEGTQQNFPLDTFLSSLK